MNRKQTVLPHSAAISSTLFIAILLIVWQVYAPNLYAPCIDEMNMPNSCWAAIGSAPWILIIPIILLSKGSILTKENHVSETRLQNLQNGARNLLKCLPYVTIPYLIFLVPIALFSGSLGMLWSRSDLLIPAMLITVGSGLQATGEELFFRGQLTITLFKIFNSSVLARILSTVAFSIGHTDSIDNLFIAVMIGSACEYLTYKTRSLEAPIALHFVHNLVMWSAAPLTFLLDTLVELIFSLLTIFSCIFFSVVLISINWNGSQD